MEFRNRNGIHGKTGDVVNFDGSTLTQRKSIHLAEQTKKLHHCYGRRSGIP
jgi:hypothetical protein